MLPPVLGGLLANGALFRGSAAAPFISRSEALPLPVGGVSRCML